MADLMLIGPAGLTKSENILMPNGEKFDTEGYSTALVQINTTGAITSGQIIFEQCNDGIRWLRVPATDGATLTPATVTSFVLAADSSRLWTIQLTCRYFRVKILPNVVGGTVQAFAVISDDVISGTSAGVNIAQWNGSTPSSGNMVHVAASTTRSNNNCTNYRRLSTADTNLAAIRNDYCRFLDLSAYNGSNAVRFVKLYNKKTAPVLATDKPVYTFALPPNSVTQLINDGIGAYFQEGIAIAITGGIADTDATAIGVNEVILNGRYS